MKMKSGKDVHKFLMVVQAGTAINFQNTTKYPPLSQTISQTISCVIFKIYVSAQFDIKY